MVSVAIVYKRFADVVPPTTTQEWGEKNAQAGSCLQARHANWTASYLAQDGRRSVCLYQAPYLQAVREGLNEVGLAYDALLEITPRLQASEDAIAAVADPIMVEIDLKQIPTDEDWTALKQAAQEALKTENIQVLIELTSPKRKGEVWIVGDAQIESVERSLKDSGIPYQGVWRSQRITP